MPRALLFLPLAALLGTACAASNKATKDPITYAKGARTTYEQAMLQYQKQHRTQWSAYTCAWYVTGSMGETLVRVEDLRPLSSFLLRQLRQYQPDLRQCMDTTIEGLFGGSDVVLFLGPVEWEKPARDAWLGCGMGHPTAGRACYSAHRGFLGRWKLTGVIRL